MAPYRSLWRKSAPSRPIWCNFTPVLACEIPGLRFSFTFSSPVAGPSHSLTRSCSQDRPGEDEVSRSHICSWLADSGGAVVLLMVNVIVKQHTGIFICFKKTKHKTRKLHIKLRRILWLKASSTVKIQNYIIRLPLWFYNRGLSHLIHLHYGCLQLHIHTPLLPQTTLIPAFP